MLEELSKQDALWREIAFKICKDKNTADEIVQEMYLRFYRNPKDKFNVSFITFALKSVFLNSLKQKKDVALDKFYYLEDKKSNFEPNDEELNILIRAESITWSQKELLQEVYDRSYREIESIYNINYGYVYRKVKEAREQILSK